MTPRFTCREMEEGDLPDVLAVRNRLFPPIDQAAWRDEGCMTAVIAVSEQQVLGAIPLSVRPFALGNGTCIRAAFENAVGVTPEHQAKGIGSALMAEAAAVLARRNVDALLVYRGGEDSAAFRFYRKTGHTELLWMRGYALSEMEVRRVDNAHAASAGANAPRPRVNMAEEMRPEDWRDVAALFRSEYGSSGGFVDRAPDFYPWVLRSAFYRCVDCSVRVILCRNNGHLEGYLLLGRNRARDWGEDTILEMAARDFNANTLHALIGEACTLAAQESRRLGCTLAGLPALHSLLLELGFVEQPRSLALMGQVPNPRGFLEARIPFPMEIWTAKGLLSLHASQGTDVMRLEMTTDTLNRFCLGRIDVAAALRDQRITVLRAHSDQLDFLRDHGALSNWIYCGTDYL